MKSRTESLQLAKHRMFDVLVIGGGLTGVGAAQNAASRGLSVMLIEKDDFASGSSSRTTKLIHGGLRYLEPMRLSRTRQLLLERVRLEKLAPHMIRGCGFVLPLSKKNPLFAWKARLALSLYDLLSLTCHGSDHFHSLSTQAVLQTAPSLSSRHLAGGLRFYDCITDDARLVLAVLKSACQQGAVAANYLEVRSFARTGTRISGVNCRDRYSGDEFVIRGKTVINATGVWSDNVCRLADPSWTGKTRRSKGVHLIVPASAFETNSGLLLEAPDNRFVFVVPWQHALLIGVTDTGYEGDIDKPLPASDEIDYLLEVVNSYTLTHHLSRLDIAGSFAALRPLIDLPGQSTGDCANLSLLPEHHIFESQVGMFNVVGGGLSGYRLLAEELVGLLLSTVPDLTARPSSTANLMLGGWTDKRDFLTQSMEIAALGRKLSLDPATIDHLISAYGSDAQVIMGLVERDRSLAERVCPNYTPLLAEVIFTVQHEMALCLEDVLFRRMRLAVLNLKQALEAAPKVARIMQQLLDWDKQRYDAEMSTVESSLLEHMQLTLEPVTHK